jgi:hypothetical protein
VDCLFSHPVIAPVKLGQILGMHYTTATRHLSELSKAGILRDVFHKKYHLFVNHRLMGIIGGQDQQELPHHRLRPDDIRQDSHWQN